MNKVALVVLSVFPLAAVAHPDHSHGTYSLVHYLSGSHMLLPLAGIAAAYLAYRLFKRVKTR